MKPKRKVILFVGLIALVTVLTGTLGGCGCAGFSIQKHGGFYFPSEVKDDEVDEKNEEALAYELYKEVESRQGNESDDLWLQFQHLVLDRVKQQGLGEFKDTDDAEDAHFSELLKIYDDLYNELLQYRKLLMVIQGTWTRVNKSNTEDSWDDNGPQITLSIVGNHQVQLVRPQLDMVPTPDNKKKVKDLAVVGSYTDMYKCDMGKYGASGTRDKNKDSNVGMILSKDNKEYLIITLNPDNTINVNLADNMDTSKEALTSAFGTEESADRVLNNVNYSKVQ